MSSKTKVLSLRNKLLASVTALVLGTATMSTGAMAFAHGGGHVGGAGGHAMAMGHGMAIGHPAVGGGYYRGGNRGRFARGYGYGGAALGLGLGLGACMPSVQIPTAIVAAIRTITGIPPATTTAGKLCRRLKAKGPL